jgi:nucleotide-binding universal stress UspA family protein
VFKRILVVLDPARQFGSAREYAIALARHWGSSVVGLYVVFEEAMPLKAAYDEAVKPQQFIGKQVVTEFGEDLAKSVDYTPVVEQGPYEVAIPNIAAREGVDLVVLGSFHASLERRLVGSDTERIIEYSPCSVLLIRDPAELPTEGSTIVLAHDGSTITKRTLKHLMRFTKSFKARVRVIIGSPARSLEEGSALADFIEGELRSGGIEVDKSQVLTSRWVLGPHGVVHRAVSGLHPSMVCLTRLRGRAKKSATHWLVHEFIRDTPCPVLVLK